MFWYEERQEWIMVVALSIEKKLLFFRSSNLRQWTESGEFGPAGALTGIWECPDLFKLVVPELHEEKWVLFVNINPGGP